MQTFEIDFRSEFPIKEKTAYFNNASYTPMCASAVKAISEALSSYSTSGPSDEFYLRFKEGGGNSARTKLASLLNASSDALVFTESATQSINLVANGLKLRKGDTIITRGGPSEHPSNFLPWRYYADAKGACIVDLRCDEYGVPELSNLDSTLARTKARLVVVSHVLYNFGSVLPAREISKISHERGALFFLDASQSVGAVPVDLKSIDPDFSAGTAAKWLCGPLGLGFFYCNERALQELEPLNFGPNSCTYKPDGSFHTLENSWKLQEGFRNWAYCFGLSASIDLIDKIGIDNIRGKDQGLARSIIESFSNSRTYNFIGNPDSRFRSSITPVEVQGPKPIDIVRRLGSRGIVIAERERGEQKILRISPHYYNDEFETEKVISELRQLAS